MANEVQVRQNVGDVVIARVNSLCEAGFTMPKDFSYVNAIKMTMLKLQDLKDKNGKPALTVCSPNSISTALFQMVTKGLNASLNQGYFLVRGDQLCFQESYFGKVLMVKRIYPDWNPNPVVIREDDVFEYGIDAKTGKKYVIKHEQKLENIDKGFVGGYIYLPTGELYILTKKQIMTAWSKSSSREQTVHKTFDEKMIGKTLISTGCNMIINSTPEYHIASDDDAPLAGDTAPEVVDLPQTDYEEFTEAEEVVEETPTPAPDALKNAKPDNFDF